MLLVKKMPTSFSVFRFGQNKTRINAYNFVEKKETFFDYKENIFNFLKIAFFHAFGQKMQ